MIIHSRRAILVVAALLLANPSAAKPDEGRQVRKQRGYDQRDGSRYEENFCSNTARLQRLGCFSAVRDASFVASAVCLNVSDAGDRSDCRSDAEQERDESIELCRDQYRARLDLCGELGEARYEPDFDPASFDTDFANPTNPNPYFPLSIGNVWEFASGEETTRIEVEDKTKSIAGVTCIVVRDVVSEDGNPVEDTDDWFGLRLDGSVVYCGESVQDFELFDGDDPQEPELVAVDGSFKAGRNGDKPGTLFPGDPVVGTFFRQEWSASNAEDAAVVLSTTYRYGDDPQLDEDVPRALAELMCDDAPCVVMGEFSPIEPLGFERKYFSRGVGKFLEINAESGEITELVACNVHPRCDDL